MDSIAIDESHYNKKEQTYYFDVRQKFATINIVNPLKSKYFNFKTEDDFKSLFEKRNSYAPFAKGKTEECISIYFSFDENQVEHCELNAQTVACSTQLTFLETEKLIYDLNDQDWEPSEWQRLRSIIMELLRYGNILKAKRLGHSLDNLNLNGASDNLNMWSITHEFSLYANQKFGEYVVEKIPSLKCVPLVINHEFAAEKRVELNSLLRKNTAFNKYSRYISEQIHFATTNKLLDSDVGAEVVYDQQDSVSVFEGAFEQITEKARHIVESHDLKKWHLVKAWCEDLKRLCLKEGIYPDFVYYHKLYVEFVQPKYGNYEFYERSQLNDTNNYFYLENLRHYTHITTPLRKEINFYLAHLIYMSLLRVGLNGYPI